MITSLSNTTSKPRAMMFISKAGERGGQVGHNVPGPCFARGPALPDVAISVSG